MKKYIITLFSLLALAQVSAWADKYDAHVSALSGNGSRESGVPFRGHFDGNGHTITVNYTASDDYCAPSRSWRKKRSSSRPGASPMT